MKIACAFVFIALFALVTAANQTASHHLILGTRLPGDRHLVREVVYSKSGLMRKKSGDYAFDQRNVPYPSIITSIEVKDQYINGNGGYATLTSGGPGFNFVKLHFTSQWWRGYNFVIDIYGK
uniref:Probable salivary secreted peptide n=1 Tax=Zeugodacus cucurbitae TaxID=28588 RepID=A0A0A1XQE6_ZEUCU